MDSCNHCHAELRAEDAHQLPHPDPEMVCFAYVCTSCFIEGTRANKKRLQDEVDRLWARLSILQEALDKHE